MTFFVDRTKPLRRVGASIAAGLLLILLAAGASSASPSGTLEADAGSARWTLGEFQLHWSSDGTEEASLRVMHRSDTDRVLWASPPGEPFLRAVDRPYRFRENRGSFRLDRGPLRCRTSRQTVASVRRRGGAVVLSGRLRDPKRPGCGTAYTLRWRPAGRDQLRFSVSLTSTRDTGAGRYSADRTRLSLRSRSRVGDRIFGFGEQFTHLDWNGRRLRVMVQEQGIFRGRQPWSFLTERVAEGASGSPYSTYVSVPFYLTSSERSLLLENTAPSEFDFTARDRAVVSVYDDRLRGRILNGRTPLDVIEVFTRYAGRMDPLPDWFHHGAIVGLQGGTEKVRDVWRKLREAGTPLAAVWLQDWVGQRHTSMGSFLWWNWDLHEGHYPDWDGLREDLRREDVRVLGYVNPMLADPSGRGHVERNLHREAQRRGYFVETPAGEPYTTTLTTFPFSLIDLTDSEARRWYRGVVRDQLLGNGFSGWMADFGEGLPTEGIVLEGGQDPRRYHNRYPVEWAKLNRRAIREAGREGEVVFFSRSGYTRSPAASTLFWEGDQLPTWDGRDGLKSALKGLLSGGLSGFSLNHSDIGGYTTVPLVGSWGFTRGEELIKRWMEASAFTAVYRSHEGSHPEANVQVYSNARVRDHFARFAHVFAALADYRRRLMQTAARKGYPLVRHPYLQYPNDPETLDLNDQYMLGSDLLVAPVMNARQRRRRLYLPAGRWTHLWSGRTREGPRWVTVDAPLGEPPVFYPAESRLGRRLVDALERRGVLR